VEQELLKKQDDENRSLALIEKEKIEKITLLFKVKTGEGDRVFGSVSAKQIREELTKKGFKIDKRQIDLDNSLSCLGFHNVKINLYKDVIAILRVNLTK